MISPPASPSPPTSGKHHTEDENSPLSLSPKRSFAHLDEDPLSQPELKRRDVQPPRRVPLNPLRLDNRLGSAPRSTDPASYQALVTPYLVADLPSPHPTQPASPGSISDAFVGAWPPPDTTPGTAQAGPSRGPLHRPDEKLSSRATFPEPTSTCDPPTPISTEPIMTKPISTTGWKAENLLQPIRSRAGSIPSIRRPPNELWRSNSPPRKINPAPANPSALPAPPGLLPRRPELRRSSFTSDLLPRGSVSFSLSLGSQPLGASEHTKAVPPIGAERSRVISITSSSRHSPTPHNHSESPWCSSPPLHAKWTNETYSSNTKPLENVQATAGSVSKEDLDRLLRNAVRNKYAPKVLSPLSPLRTSAPVPHLSSDPELQLRMPSRLNTPSPRYSYCSSKRSRTTCDAYQSSDWNATCTHCQECKRDSIGKRLLSFRCRQQQIRYTQRSKLLVYPTRGATPSLAEDGRIVHANRTRGAFAYEMDQEEKNLWDEVAAATGAAPVPFSRGGAPCAVAATTHRRIVDGSEHDRLLEISDQGLLANRSAILFRDVSVY